ncbi:hypothetical protein [Azospirillum canadense]|uniref:hypothetical protein n=1 Tax=Azospirillum canadense TaxID=403962 RepID=UPI0022271502|nr:hypothetical protein [Azospirillum canadense]MCW2242284.1 hypothetical protein [Azospirillum canadense]
MPPRKSQAAGIDVDIVKKATRKKELPPVSKAYLETALAPLASQMPSQAVAASPVASGEVLPPQRDETPAIPDRFFNVEQFEELAVDAWQRGKAEAVRLGKIIRVGLNSFEHGAVMQALDRVAALVGEHPSKLRRLMRVAEVIDQKLLPGKQEEWESEPAKADAAQRLLKKLSAFGDEAVDKAVADGILSPTATVKAMDAYGKALRSATTAVTVGSQEDADRAELARLEAERARLDERIAALRAKLETVPT